MSLDYETYIEPDLLARLTPDQAKLAQLMSDISEECWCAGWLIGTEFRLWEAITDPADHHHWGQDIIGEEERKALKDLSDKIGGWIHWTEGGEQFASMDAWLAMFAAGSGPHSRPAP